MTVRLRMGLEPLRTVPSLSKEAPEMQMQAVPSLSKEGRGKMDDTGEHEEFKPLQQQYTSLRDLIAVSPTRRGAQDVEWCDTEEPKFKDKLLKLAARAYLQPIVRESTPQTHFVAQCWAAFTSTNRSLVMGIIEGIQRQADACVKFLRTQTFSLVQRFKPQQRAAISQ